MGTGLVIGDVFRNAARAVPGRPAAHLGDQTLTFGQLDALGNQHAHLLAAEGVRPGDRVVYRGDTTLAVLPLFVALAKLGAVFAPLNPRLSDEEAAGPIAAADPRLVVTDESLGELAERAARGPTDDVAVEVDEGDTHVLFFTSGSTGEAKGVVLSHRANWLRTFQGALLEPRGGTVCMFPLFHMAGWTIGLGCWQSRTPVTFVPTPTAEALLGEVARRRAERLYAIPAVWSRILEAHRGDGDGDLSSLRLADTGTSATPPELLEAIKAAFPNTRSRVFYGSTEAGPGTMLDDADLADHPGSVGLPQPGVEVRLSDEGEVQMRGPFLFDGYHGDPEATAAAMHDGWYRTGDLGVLDDRSYLSVVGRAREVIRTGGETVSPAEVERVVATHPDVAEVAVIGVPDVEWGEVVCAVVVVAGDQAPDVAGLRAHCDSRLAAFKHPRRVEVVDRLPRTAATGQVQRTLLVERLQ
jgi:acyl-CoA synthetase (AMP-forming)/AMP-acid ligase II